MGPLEWAAPLPGSWLVLGSLAPAARHCRGCSRGPWDSPQMGMLASPRAWGQFSQPPRLRGCAPLGCLPCCRLWGGRVRHDLATEQRMRRASLFQRQLPSPGSFMKTSRACDAVSLSGREERWRGGDERRAEGNDTSLEPGQTFPSLAPGI